MGLHWTQHLSGLRGQIQVAMEQLRHEDPDASIEFVAGALRVKTKEETYVFSLLGSGGIESMPLQKHCQEFIRDYQISCADTIYHSESVIENATSFIEGICDIVGYHKGEGE